MLKSWFKCFIYFQKKFVNIYAGKGVLIFRMHQNALLVGSPGAAYRILAKQGYGMRKVEGMKKEKVTQNGRGDKRER